MNAGATRDQQANTDLATVQAGKAKQTGADTFGNRNLTAEDVGCPEITQAPGKRIHMDPSPQRWRFSSQGAIGRNSSPRKTCFSGSAQQARSYDPRHDPAPAVAGLATVDGLQLNE